MGKLQRITPTRMEQLGLFLVLGVYAATVLAYLDFVPIWDGLSYSRDCLMKGVKGPLSLLSFNCFGHPTMAYVSLLALPQYLDVGNVALLHGANLLLGACSIVAFLLLLRRLYPGDQRWGERLLVTAVYAGYPLVLANTLNMNPDFGVLVFFVITLSLMAHGRVRWAAVSGLLLTFSKEPGVLLLACMVASYAGFFLLREGTAAQRLRRLVRLWPLCLPPLLLAAFFAYKARMAGPVLWAATDAARPENLLRAFFSFSLTDPTFLGYARGIFLINFNWIMTLLVVALLLTRGVQLALRRPRPAPKGCQRAATGFVLALFFLVFYLLTRFPTYINLRYVLPIYPLLIVFAYHALCVLLSSRALRLVALGALFVLSYGSSFITFDPVSRWAYKTFKFGSQDMLQMATVTGECCGYGRDQLVYNLQFTKFHDVVNAVLQDLKPTPKTVVLAHSGFRDVVTPQADFQLVGSVDRQTFRRTLLEERDLGFRTERLRRLVLWKDKPEVLYYMDLPNFDSTRELRITNMLYRVEWVRSYGDLAHFIRVIKFRKRKQPLGARPVGPRREVRRPAAR